MENSNTLQLVQMDYGFHSGEHGTKFYLVDNISTDGYDAVNDKYFDTISEAELYAAVLGKEISDKEPTKMYVIE